MIATRNALTIGSLAAVFFLASGCKKADSKFSQLNKKGQPTDQIEQGQEPTQKPTAELPKDLEGRVARVERRLDKVIGVLEQALPPADPDPNTVYSVKVDAIDPTEGPADAKVTIIEGFEFKCPYCAIVAPTVDQILAKYPKDVRVVSKYLLIHGQSAMPSAMAACAAAKQGKYGPMKKALWDSLFKMEGGRPMMQEQAATAEAVRALATTQGLDMAKYDTDVAGDECKSWLSSSAAVLRPLGANGTPSFFINGRFLNGAQPLEAFEQIIQQEIAKADKAIADGVAAKDYYNTIVTKGETKVKGRFED